MAETKTCSFTGKQIPPGTGMMYVKKTGQVLYFISSKAKKNYYEFKGTWFSSIDKRFI